MPEAAEFLPIPTTAVATAEPEKPGLGLLLSTVETYVSARGGGEGLFKTPMSGVHIIRSFEARMPNRQMYRPSLCVVLQGGKQIHFGEDTLNYGAMECLVVSMELPAAGRIIQASADEPFVGLTIDLDLGMVRETVQQLAPPATQPVAPSGACAFVVKVDGGLADGVQRLVRLAETPEAVPVLYPLIMREICYWLLSGQNGDMFRKLAMPETHAERVAKALRLLRDNFSRALRVEELADTAGMSPSSFHQHFKALTSMTPLQYQKQLRLLEARRLMVAETANVAQAAYEVGYESASQFSREYVRMFGVAPKRDVMNYRALLEQATRHV
ncbi:AraC family transcriptional regulator [Phenylobacterium deserti]|uniref:AraC family transcriptional regulator n=1 Tax=Phenylobacterium deserti TaxID=1914756 RepID=A0A328ADG1_9CAUL|nr:AraC family transcriptional regulator [Phenylobacterium deserti]RAK52680.1 AraC family transcriptional regulator [Phenylobacterium deserti]